MVDVTSIHSTRLGFSKYFEYNEFYLVFNPVQDIDEAQIRQNHGL